MTATTEYLGVRDARCAWCREKIAHTVASHELAIERHVVAKLSGRAPLNRAVASDEKP